MNLLVWKNISAYRIKTKMKYPTNVRRFMVNTPTTVLMKDEYKKIDPVIALIGVIIAIAIIAIIIIMTGVFN